MSSAISCYLVFLIPTEVNEIQFKRMYDLKKVAIRCVRQLPNDLLCQSLTETASSKLQQ